MPRQRSQSHRAEGYFIVSRSNDLFICDSLNGPIQKGTTDGYHPRTVVRSSRFRPSELLVNCHGNIITLDTQRGNGGHLGFELSATALTRCLEELEEIDIRMLSTVEYALPVEAIFIILDTNRRTPLLREDEWHFLLPVST